MSDADRIDRIVVVGHGIAGLTTCDALRASGYDGELTIVGEELHAPYSRPALSKALLHEGADAGTHELPAPTHAATEIRGVRATGLDPDERVVTLADGSELGYDRLVIATGSRARRLSPDTDASASVERTLRTLDDALALRRALADNPSVLIVGGGPLGMEIASACLDSGCAVTLISDVAPLSSHLGPYLSEVFCDAARERGLELVIAGSVTVSVRDGAIVVCGPDGRAYGAELVITAAGDIPNVEWLADSGLLCDGVLRADSRGRVCVTDPRSVGAGHGVRADIVAVGDVAAVPTSRGIRRVPLWSSAIEQATVGARALLFGDAAAELELAPYFWTEQFGLSLKACGELPVLGEPAFIEGSDPSGPALMRWEAAAGGTGCAVAINKRIAIPKLRRLTAQPPAAVHAASA